MFFSGLEVGSGNGGGRGWLDYRGDESLINAGDYQDRAIMSDSDLWHTQALPFCQRVSDTPFHITVLYAHLSKLNIVTQKIFASASHAQDWIQNDKRSHSRW